MVRIATIISKTNGWQSQASELISRASWFAAAWYCLGKQGRGGYARRSVGSELKHYTLQNPSLCPASSGHSEGFCKSLVYMSPLAAPEQRSHQLRKGANGWDLVGDGVSHDELDSGELLLGNPPRPPGTPPWRGPSRCAKASASTGKAMRRRWTPAQVLISICSIPRPQASINPARKNALAASLLGQHVFLCVLCALCG